MSVVGTSDCYDVGKAQDEVAKHFLLGSEKWVPLFLRQKERKENLDSAYPACICLSSF